MSLSRGISFALASAIALTACSNSSKEPVGPRPDEPSPNTPSLTAGSGSVSTVLGRAQFGHKFGTPFNVKRVTGDWQVEINANRGLDLAVQNISFDPGGQSGWHSHPGPVFIQVVSGTMTFYESDDPTCTPIVRTAGHGYLDLGDDAHIARNETSAPAANIVTYFAPPGAALRIDQPRPGNCPF